MRTKKYTGTEFGPEGPEIGDKHVFTPAAFFSAITGFALRTFNVDDQARVVTGTCVYINEEHRFARYRYETDLGGEAFECFKF